MIKRGLTMSLPLLAVIAGLAIYGWLVTPGGASLAVHWNLAGEPDRYGGKAEAFLMIPAIALLVSLLMAAAPLIDPRGRNLHRSSAVYLIAWIGTLFVLAAAQAALTFVATDLLDNYAIPGLLGGAVSLLIIALGNVLTKARPNWFVGVRTPWTLSSDRAWDVTHRWAGRGFVLSGLSGLAGLLLGAPGTGFVLLGGGALATAVFSVVLSYFVWRQDPRRETFSADGGS